MRILLAVLLAAGPAFAGGIVSGGRAPSVEGSNITAKTVTITNTDVGADFTVNTATMVVKDGRVAMVK